MSIDTPEGLINVGCWYNRVTDGRLPLEDLTKRLSRKPKKLIISMDANAKNEEWGFSTDVAGIHLKRILNHFKFSIINSKKEVTRMGFGNDCASVIDLIVTSFGLRKRRPKCSIDQNADYKSDHAPIKFTINSGLNSTLNTNVILYDKLVRKLKTNSPFKDLSDLSICISKSFKSCSINRPMREKKIRWSPEILDLKRIAMREKRKWIDEGRKIDEKVNYQEAWLLYKKKQEAFCVNNKMVIEDEKTQAAWRALRTHPVSSLYKVLKNGELITNEIDGKIAIMDSRTQWVRSITDNLDSQITFNEVKWAFSKIKSSTPAGTLGTSLRTLTKIFTKCPRIIVDTINNEYVNGLFSSHLKYSKATILPKSLEEIVDVKNFRIVLSAPIIAKVYEKILLRRLELGEHTI